MTNKRDGTLYTGVTSDLVQRIHEHKNNVKAKFASKYNCKILVYYETFDDIENAIMREKQLKAGSRKKKIELIETLNSDWRDLYEDIIK